MEQREKTGSQFLSKPSEVIDFHDVIENWIQFSLFDIFNRETFDEEVIKTKTFKQRYYFCSRAAGMCLVCTLLFTVLFYAVLQGEASSVPGSPHDDLSLRFSGFGLFSFLCATLTFAYTAQKNRVSFQQSEKERLLKNAHHPGMASQIYDAVKKAVDQKIPFYYMKNELAHELPLYKSRGLAGPRDNALFVLLGSESHRSALVKDGIVPAGRIFISSKDQSGLEALKKLRLGHSKDDRDNRVMKEVNDGSRIHPGMIHISNRFMVPR